jgi:ribosome-binding protein aMBF1 (putative translation factor)
MNHAAIKAAREAMSMSPNELAQIMEIAPSEIYRIEGDRKNATARKPPKRFVSLMKALMTGWRPT